MRSFAEQSCRGVDTAFSDCSSSWRSRRRERFKRVAILEVVDVDVSSRLVGVDSGARAGRGGEPSAAEPTGGSRGISSVDGKTLPACHLASARRGNWRGNCFGVLGGWRMLASGERLRNW